MQGCDDVEKAQAIYGMREEARREFPGNIKTNNRLAAFFWNYIADIADGLDSPMYIEPAANPVKKPAKKRGRPSKDDKTFAAPPSAKKVRFAKAKAS